MARVNYDELLKHYRAAPAQAARLLHESMESKQLRASDFDFGRLFEACFGYEEWRACREGRQRANDVFARYGPETLQLAEADGAVSTAAFQNISGQIVYSATLEAYEKEENVFSSLIPEEMITNGTLDGEKIAGLTEIGDEAAVRNEGDPYPLAGFGENWIFAPAVKDRGFIVPLTWEAVFADRTGQILQRAGDVGSWLAINKEKRAIDCVIDQNTTAHRYNWRNVGVIQTYNDNIGTHTWDNLQASNALVDWTNLNAAEQLFNGLTDPFTGNPIAVTPKHLVVCKNLEQTANRIVNATEIRVTSPGYATSGNPTQTVVKNPYQGKYQVVTSRQLGARIDLNTTWFLGDIGKLAWYRVAEKLNVQQAPAGNPDEFKRRIVGQYRVNERGAYYVVEPRASTKNTA